MAGKHIGVLALQGAFIEHVKLLEALGATATLVKKPEELDNLDGLIMPGGESTAIGKLMVKHGLAEPLQALARQDFPIWGTCAGMILLAQRVVEDDLFTLGLMDMTVKRNGFGRQKESFTTKLAITGLDNPAEAVFIRAPFVVEAGPEVNVLAHHADKIVMVKQGRLLASAFHPELTNDTSVHELFLKLC